MSLTGIISISGASGLHKILSHAKNGLIVESLIDGRRRPVYSTQKVSSLEDISIYTLEEDMPLKDVFKLIFDKEKGKAAPDYKSDTEKLKDYLLALVPKLDLERVYNSDIVKLFQWYNLLIEKDLMSFEEDKEEETEEEGAKKKTSKTKKTPSASKEKKVAPKNVSKAKPAVKKAMQAPSKAGRSSKKA